MADCSVVLSRRPSESVVILPSTGEIRVTVVQTSAYGVLLRFSGAGCRVVKAETMDAVKRRMTDTKES